MIRFNTDSGSLEYYSGELWVNVIVNNNELGDQKKLTLFVEQELVRYKWWRIWN